MIITHHKLIPVCQNDKNIFGAAINFCNVQYELKITVLNKKPQPKVQTKLKVQQLQTDW